MAWKIRAEGRGDRLVARAKVVVVGFHVFDEGCFQGFVLSRYAVVGRALEDRQMLRLLGDQRDRLDARRTGADDAHSAAGEIHAVLGPLARVIGIALEIGEAGKVRNVCRAQATGGHDEVIRAGGVVAVDLYVPALALHVIGRRCDGGLEADQAP